MSRWSDIIRATNAQILTWAEAQPWARAMAACQQDAQWHAEGDVWTHTRMVCAELERLADWPSLDAICSELDVDATDNQGTIIQFAREQCRDHFRAGRDFAFNATNITCQMRGRWIELFADYNARVEIIYLEPPLRTILMQNQRRTNPVPEKVIERLLERLAPPTITECHALTIAELSTP